MRIVRYPVDALYPSPYDWVSSTYLMEKVKIGIWENIFLDKNLIKIVSPESMTFNEYKHAWVNLSGDAYGLKQRYEAMTKCPLLKTLYGVCEIPTTNP